MIEVSIAKHSAKQSPNQAAKRPGAGGLGIRTKLLLAFAGVAALTLLGSGVALVSYGHVNGAFERVTGWAASVAMRDSTVPRADFACRECQPSRRANAVRC